MHATPRPAPRGFTLIELLVVLAIVGLISAVALPVVLPALNERKINEAARLLQAVLAGARDTAVRAGAPRGVRFLIDPVFNGGTGLPLASNRMIAIEPGPDYSEGLVLAPTLYYPSPNNAILNPVYSTPITVGLNTASHLRVATSGLTTTTYNPPTGWSYNIRQGDKIRFHDSGNYYTIAGPVGNAGSLSGYNPERFIICPTSLTTPLATDLTTWIPEYLNLTNGIDDDGDGWIDESCDGIDNDGDGLIDPGFDGIDNDGQNGIDDPGELFYNANGSTTINEYEPEVFVGTQANSPPLNDPYIISRRPVVSPGARETTLPDGVVLDLTTWNASAATPGTFGPNTIIRPLLPERSRLPVDPYTGFVDVMIAPNGQVVLPGAGGGGNFARTPIANTPFYHFWLTDREGVHGLLWEPPTPGSPYAPKPNPSMSASPSKKYLLPMPKGTPNYAPMPDNPNNSAQNYSANPVFLTGGRRLVTLFTKTGQIMTNSIEAFDATDVNLPYYAAQTGIKEPQ